MVCAGRSYRPRNASGSIAVAAPAAASDAAEVARSSPAPNASAGFNCRTASMTGDQVAQVDVAERRHQCVGDGVGCAVQTRDRGVDILHPATEVEHVVDRSRCRQGPVNGTGVGERAGVSGYVERGTATGDGELGVGEPEQVRHLVVSDDAADLGSSAVVDVEVLLRQRQSDARRWSVYRPPDPTAGVRRAVG